LKPVSVLILAAWVVTLAACDQPKPRAPPPPGGPPGARQDLPAPASEPGVAASLGLKKQPGMAGFSLDLINQAPDPLNRPATITAGGAVKMSGFGFDPATRTPGKAVDLVLDGVAYPTTYGSPRGDVAAYTHAPALAKTGFQVTLPAGVVKPGAHTAIVRVVSADGAGFTDGATISFVAK
jgi:hypothetical protein